MMEPVNVPPQLSRSLEVLKEMFASTKALSLFVTTIGPGAVHCPEVIVKFPLRIADDPVLRYTTEAIFIGALSLLLAALMLTWGRSEPLPVNLTIIFHGPSPSSVEREALKSSMVPEGRLSPSPLLPLPPQEKSPRDKAAAEREDNTHLFVNRENIKKKIFFKDSDSVRRVNT